jgi:hypothetical protein
MIYRYRFAAQLGFGDIDRAFDERLDMLGDRVRKHRPA